MRAADVRARRGARWLDENFSGWEKRINIQTLELENGTRCICGQVFAEEAREHSLTEYEFVSGYSWAETHLFADANSWIKALVPMSKSGDEEEREIRAANVAVVLGFVAGEYNGPGHTKTDEACVDFDDLQEAWVALLKKRANDRAKLAKV